MRKIMAALVFSSACLFGVQAEAVTVTITDLANGVEFPTGSPPPGTTGHFETFNSAPSSANFTDSFATFSSTGAQVVTGSSTNNNAAPFFGVGSPNTLGTTGFDSTPYLSVFGSTSETITLKAGLIGSVFGLYIGSLDAYNSIEFLDSGTPITTQFTDSPLISGTDIASATGKSTTQPNQTGYASNGFFLFSGLGPFNEIILSSSSNSFEVDNVVVATTGSLQGAVPETSTWIMMILGFLAVGFTAYRRKPRGLSFRIA